MMMMGQTFRVQLISGEKGLSCLLIFGGHVTGHPPCFSGQVSLIMDPELRGYR